MRSGVPVADKADELGLTWGGSSSSSSYESGCYSYSSGSYKDKVYFGTSGSLWAMGQDDLPSPKYRVSCGAGGDDSTGGSVESSHELVYNGGECLSSDKRLPDSPSAASSCAASCAAETSPPCAYFSWRPSDGQCYAEYPNSPTVANSYCAEGFDTDNYDYYRVLYPSPSPPPSPPPVPAYYMIETGTCPEDDLITDKSACEAAAVALELSDTGATTTSNCGVKAKGCGYPSGYLYVYADSCSGSCSTTNPCICKQALPDPPSPPMPPAPPPDPPSPPLVLLWESNKPSVCTVVADDEGNPGQCVVDSGGTSGNYGSSEDCTMTALVGMSVSSVGTFSTESVSYDYLQLGQSPNTKWGGSTGPSNVEMAAGDTMVRSPARSHTHARS